MEVGNQPFTMLVNEIMTNEKGSSRECCCALDAVYVEAVRKVWLVMEYMQGCMLNRVVKRYPTLPGNV